MLSAFNVLACARSPALHSIRGRLTQHPMKLALQQNQSVQRFSSQFLSKNHLLVQPVTATGRLLLRRWAGSKIPPPNLGGSKRVKLKKSDIQRLIAFAKNEKGLLWGLLTLLTKFLLIFIKNLYFLRSGGVACLIVSSTITMCVPYALGRILDIIALDKDSIEATKIKLSDFCLILCGVFLIGGFANFGRVYLFNKSCK